MEARTVSHNRFSPAVSMGDGPRNIVRCPRCGRKALLFVERGLNVYEHRPSHADETREVCILP